MNTGRTSEQEAMRRDRAVMVEWLESAGAVFKGSKACRCPFHDDRSPSAGIFEGNDGSWHFKCQVCGVKGDVFDVMARVRGIPVTDVLAEHRPVTAPCKGTPKRPEAPHEQPAAVAARRFADLDAVKASARGLEATYVYANPETRAAEMIVLRIRRDDGGKQFLQFRPVAGGGFEAKAPAAPRPLYNRSRMLAAEQIVIVEGEKVVHALAEIGIVATTSPGGAGNAAHADWSPLAGKTCVLWPDSDPPNPPGKPNAGKRTGIEHMRDVAAQLEKISPSPRVSWIDPDDLSLPDKGDAVDFIAEYGGASIESRRRAVETVISIASPIGPADELFQLIEDSIAGRRRAIPFPWPNLTRLSRALTPGTVTVIAGDPGFGKSLLLLEAANYWHGNGVKVAIYELEDDRSYHLNRVLAQREDNSNLVDSEWLRTNPDEARAAMTRQRAFLDGFARCITTPPGNDVTLRDLLKWIEQQCAAGADIVIVDPVTGAGYATDRSWQEDRDFIMQAKAIAKEHGSRLILATHPKMGTKAGGKVSPLHSMAGGAAYPRFAHTVLWITAPEKPRKVMVSSDHGPFSTSANRTLRLGKTRNGPGSGMEIAFIFDGATLRFSEQGTILKNDDRGPAIEDPFDGHAPTVTPQQELDF